MEISWLIGVEFKVQNLKLQLFLRVEWTANFKNYVTRAEVSFNILSVSKKIYE